jgi:hypothetical protein
MKLILKKEPSNSHLPFTSHDRTIITFEVDDPDLTEILTEFELFLKGCGFHFKGHLDFVDEGEE